ncbi:MAG: 16S rRNA (guanine(966)-N(2))-methyltransferase RsmD [Peptococcaceae bacterium]|jgi:16S rRNA (guanine(966)-N(2))-methyltransferase RsmD|nr:16S rRNA (guanine(966)-N(2))-methyltransferase RsmD [Peptococcaceae bacterium]
MRVIAGNARGRRLLCFDDRRIRPTLDRVKEAVFSSLMPRLPGSRVLDLFAGSGALGIEALSRGARSVTFVEIDQKTCDLIKSNLTGCGWSLSEDTKVIHREAIRWLKTKALMESQTFDIILADPPYKKGFEDSLLAALAGGSLLAPEGVIMLESDAHQVLPESQGRLRLSKSKTYGDSKVSYYTVDSGSTGNYSDPAKAGEC